jgi:succinylglutamic semialdehyde dehydrogenase
MTFNFQVEMTMDLEYFRKALVNKEFPLNFPGHYIDGSWYKEQKISAVRESLNPNNGEKLIDIFLERETVAKAVESTLDAKKNTLQMTQNQRVEILQKLSHLLIEYRDLALTTMMVEAGKPRWEAEWDFDQAISFLQDVCRDPDDIWRALAAPYKAREMEGEFRFQPVGATVAYLPLFTPYTSFVTYITASIFSGSPLLLVSSTHAVLAGMLIGLWVGSLDLPKGAFNIVFGNFSFLKHIITNPHIQVVIYKGSKEHCLTLRKESSAFPDRQLLLQSGGKNSILIDESADIDVAVKSTFWGIIKNAGQLCSSTSRAFVPESMLAEYSSRLCDMISKIKIGRTDGDGNPHMGPLYAQKNVEKFLRFQTMAKRESDETLLWGRVLDNFKSSNFVSPGVHLLRRFDPTKAYQYNVLMTPDIAIYPYSDVETAVQNVNMTDSPLVVALMGDKKFVDQYGYRFEAPNVVVNMPTVQIEHTLPITGKFHCGGYRLSGKYLAIFMSYPQAVLASPPAQSIDGIWPR